MHDDGFRANAMSAPACALCNSSLHLRPFGRHAGYIAAHASLANGDVDLVLIPELDVDVDPNSSTNVLSHVERVVRKKGHAVVVVAEGAAEEILLKEATAGHKTDAKGTQPKLPPVGEWLKEVT